MLTVVLVAVLSALILLVLVTLKPESRELALTWLVGATGALMAVQVVQVHAFTIAVVLWAVLTRRDGRVAVPALAATILLAATLLASTVLYGQLVNSQTLGLQLIALAASAAIIVTRVDRRSIFRMLMAVLVVVSGSSFLALMQVAGIAPVEIWHLDVSALGRPVGIYPEPDWLGMFAGLGILLAWRLRLRRYTRALLLTVNIAAWVLAFARAAWIAVAVAAVLGLIVYLITWRRRARETKSGRVLGVSFVSIAGVLAFELIPSLHDNVLTRLGRTFTVAADDISAQARVNQNAGMLDLATSAPWYGWGLSASGRVGVFGGVNTAEISRNNVGSNWLLSWWAEGAVLALPMIILFLVTMAITARTMQAQMLLVVVVSSFFSNAMYQPIAWLLLGLCLAEVRLRREARRGSVSDAAKSSGIRLRAPAAA